MGDRVYLSIGEVLSLLKEEFPDVTISKIRFLESQGLLDPERTASGYRKFYEPDVERLRWILRQQREHFLPLKVIKGRLGVADPDDAGAAPEVPSPGPGPVAAEPVPEPEPEPVPIRPAPAARPVAVDEPRLGPVATGAVPPPPPQSALSAGISGVSLTIEELSAASGLAYEQLRELERFGFLAGRPVAGTVYYDEEALVVANLAAGFARFGIEGRHLRTYKNAADREAGLFEQIVTPLFKQRNPEARRQAVTSLDELAHLGQGLRAAMLRQALRRLTGG
ncbi:MAG TPA: MerR family transcriptional regulator [Dermatophilaceae bacterium]|nr:MerR family transcriptional regulator [Dermatophilaceae bacterium]